MERLLLGRAMGLPRLSGSERIYSTLNKGTKPMMGLMPWRARALLLRTFVSPTEKKENIYTLPNAITMGRILVTPAIGYYISTSRFEVALGLLVVAAASDFLDGFIARRFNKKTSFGTVLDPAADKILMTTLTIGLCHAGLLSLPLSSLIIGRDIGLVGATMIYRYRTLPAPKTFSRFWDVSLVSAEVRPPFISKLNTALQLILMYSSLAAPVYGISADHLFLEGMRWTVAATTIASIVTYWVRRRELVRAL